MIREKSPKLAKPEPVGLAAQRMGCWDSELAQAEYTARAGFVRLHRSQTPRERRVLLNIALHFSPADLNRYQGLRPELGASAPVAAPAQKQSGYSTSHDESETK